MPDIIKKFFDTFEIEPIKIISREYDAEGEICSYYVKYPEITDNIFLKLEDIFAHNRIDATGFFDGFKVEKHYEYWIYQLTYYKGGYYTCGFGKTRQEALLNQFIIILNDKEVEEKEKQLIKQQVQELFKGG